MSSELLLLLLWLVVLAAGIFVVYSGWFYDIHVMIDRPQLAGKLKIAYKFARGPYKNCRTIFAEVCNVAPAAKKIGIFYDKPQEVAAEQLRYAAGIITAVNDVSEVDDATVKELKSRGYSFHELPAIDKAVVTDFKHSTFLSLFLAIWRVYDYIHAFQKEHKVSGFPVVEMYFGGKIHYFLPLAENQRFFVWEAEKKAK